MPPPPPAAASFACEPLLLLASLLAPSPSPPSSSGNGGAYGMKRVEGSRIVCGKEESVERTLSEEYTAGGDHEVCDLVLMHRASVRRGQSY